MSNGDGLTTCTSCSSNLEKGEIGYCAICCNAQEEESKYIYQLSHKEIVLRSENQRLALIKFYEDPLYKNTHLNLSETKSSKEGGSPLKIFAILDPRIASSVDYSIVLEVDYIRKINEGRIKELKDYWYNKYEIEMEEFDYQVGLIFWNESYYGDEMYSSVYDFPCSIVSDYVLRERRRS